MGEFEVVDVQEQKVASVRRTVPTAELPAFFAQAFNAVAAAVEAGGGALSGPPFGRYRSLPTETVDVEAGFPVEGWDGSSGEVSVRTRPGGRAVAGVHVGPYDTMTETYERLRAWCAEQGVSLATEMWEEYTSPPEGDPSTWRTRITWLVGP